MAPAFLARLAADRENADMVARSLGVVLVSTNLSSAVAERSDIPKALELKAADTPSDAVDAVVERYGVDRGESEALVRALNVRGKKVVLVDSASTAATARELGLSAISYDEILASLRSKEPTTTSEESVGLDE
jgi:predicted nucleic acid-binding protein